MFDSKLLSNISNIAISVGILVGGISFVIAQIRSGSGKAREELILVLQEEIKAEKQKVEDLREQIRNLMQAHKDEVMQLHHTIGSFSSRTELAEKKLNEYFDILTHRDPQFTKSLITILNFAKESKQIMRTIQQALHIKNTAIEEVTTIVS